MLSVDDQQAMVARLLATIEGLYETEAPLHGPITPETSSVVAGWISRITNPNCYTAQEPAAKRIGEFGWTVPTWATVDFVSGIPEDASAQTVDRIFLSAYRKIDRRNEATLLSACLSRQFLRPWRVTLGDAVWAYRARRYRVVVPALLTVLDGTVQRAANHPTATTNVKRMVEHATKIEPGIVRLAWISIKSFVDATFLNHPFSSSPPSRLNRHWILHGRDTASHGRTECLRLFQALDTLSLVAEHPQLSSHVRER